MPGLQMGLSLPPSQPGAAGIRPSSAADAGPLSPSPATPTPLPYSGFLGIAASDFPGGLRESSIDREALGTLLHPLSNFLGKSAEYRHALSQNIRMTAHFSILVDGWCVCSICMSRIAKDMEWLSFQLAALLCSHLSQSSKGSWNRDTFRCRSSMQGLTYGARQCMVSVCLVHKRKIASDTG